MSSQTSQSCTGFESPFGLSRRTMLQRFGMGLGTIALSQLESAKMVHARDGVLKEVHHPPKAKRVIYLFQSGGPSQLDLFDYRPELQKVHGQQLPDEIRQGQRLTAMSGNQASLPMVKSPFKYSQHGESGQWVSEVLPNISKIADDICICLLYTSPSPRDS